MTRPVARWREGRLQQYGDQIAEEVPVAIMCNGEHFAVMMATPAQLEDFALGFALSEGLIAAPQELLDLQIQPRLEGVELQLQIPPDRAQALAARKNYEFALVLNPPRLRGMTGAPVNAFAIIPQ